ncbi:Cu(I)/Ag(I) efflux system membrane fusion protein [Luteibacter rhizovicinus]|uniref:Cu(I)/Ag(I) efflux system membrane fusion protein n=1 Tax=Luteibacter rhizovicinus TaxID=242606 RepID=A0A4R3YQY2_9GAMM|nr:efflux RND transporter periplasmic adaptor subunit [Luteibacter rhizovicinus]TCV93373.1 Cu(I)/Ag(I) efflux system membrane fusion protein [Luteibacter rhizovicinus]
MKRPLQIALVALVLLITATLAYWTGRRHAPVTTAASSSPSKAAPRYWYDPMVPDQHFDHPGLSPMGMEMLPRYDSAGDAKDVVRIDPATVQNLGVRTAPIERRVLDGDVQAPGSITWDLRQAITVSARVDAVVTKLDVRAPYTTVAEGTPLVDLLAPQWSSAMAEAEALRDVRSADAKALRDAARQRLQVLGLSPADSGSARRSGGAITVHAPRRGVVTSLEVREGQRVNAGQTLMTINGIDTVWIEAALPQAVAGAISANTPVKVRVDALPGRVFEGKVETLLPDIDVTTRTQRARIVLANPEGVLSPGMFAHVQLIPGQGVAVPVVPDEALIATGGRTRVIVAENEGHFRPVAVRTGRAAGGYTEVLEGLHGDEKVVVSGQFLIDSEASLSGALDRLDSDATSPASAQSAPVSGMPMGDGR